MRVEKIIVAMEIKEKIPPEACRYSNVVTQMAFERMVSASGPYGGIIMRPFDGDIPKRIAFIQGEADEDEDEDAPLAFELLLQEAKSAKEQGVDSCIIARELYEDTGKLKSIKSHHIMVTEMEETKNVSVQYVVEGEKKSEEFDMAVLSVGFSLPEYIKKIGALVGIKPEELKSRMPRWSKRCKGFVEVEIMKTEKEGVFIAI